MLSAFEFLPPFPSCASYINPTYFQILATVLPAPKVPLKLPGHTACSDLADCPPVHQSPFPSGSFPATLPQACILSVHIFSVHLELSIDGSYD